VRPVVGVPEKEYRALEARFRERHPDVVDTLADYAVFAEAVHPVEGVGDLGMLGQREREVGGLLVGGGTSAQIAATLGISVNTVKTHMRAIYAKLGVHTRTAAVDELRRLGLGARESSGEGRR
jgi:DNA-binding CsgD family transcriptional regulator